MTMATPPGVRFHTWFLFCILIHRIHVHLVNDLRSFRRNLPGGLNNFLFFLPPVKRCENNRREPYTFTTRADLQRFQPLVSGRQRRVFSQLYYTLSILLYIIVCAHTYTQTNDGRRPVIINFTTGRDYPYGVARRPARVRLPAVQGRIWCRVGGRWIRRTPRVGAEVKL